MDGAIAVAGLYTLETNLRIQGFPLAYYPMGFPFHGIVQNHGGVGLNLACALARLGQPVRFASLVGDDDAGHAFRQALPAMGLADDLVASYAGATSHSVILVAPDGSRQAHCDLKDLQDAHYPMPAALLDGAALALICNINFARPLIAQAQARMLPIATDVHALNDFDDAYNRDFMAAAEILFLSHERLPCPPAEAAAALQARYPARIIVIGMGADGSLLAERGSAPIRLPARQPREVINTIGAGDALFACFLDQHLRGLPPAQALARATLYAGWKTGESGATRGLLDASAFAALCTAEPC